MTAKQAACAICAKPVDPDDDATDTTELHSKAKAGNMVLRTFTHETCVEHETQQLMRREPRYGDKQAEAEMEVCARAARRAERRGLAEWEPA